MILTRRVIAGSLAIKELFMHGGDIYRNNIYYDFSVNLNPLGVPQEVQWVLSEATKYASKYPDILHEKLVESTSKIFDIMRDDVVYGNGASELVMAICHAYHPKKAMIVSPCFLGYEICLKGAVPNCTIIKHQLLAENDFAIYQSITETILVERPNLLFLTNPNNPNGLLMEKAVLTEVIKACEKAGTILVVDECFLPLTGKEKECSLAYNIVSHKSLIVLRAFTKSFAIPGVRLGYALCSRKSIADTIKSHLPEWNLSIFAQMAGVECLKHLEYIDEAVELIEKEREFLSDGLKDLKLKVFNSDANYILFKSENKTLKENLLLYNILIRDCSDYAGLEKGYYRIAVKQHNENEGLLSALEGLC